MLTQLKKNLRKNPTAWRYLFNNKPSMAYSASSEKMLAEPVRQVISDLRKNGIARSTVKELFPDNSLYEELVQSVEKLEAEKQEYISQAKAKVSDHSILNEKTFMLFLLDPLNYDDSSIWARFAKQEPIWRIADAYYRMKNTELRYYNIWHTIPYTGPARTSQLWHRDREDLQILKVFVYLTDVDAGAGPFTYAPGTHIFGKHRGEPEYHTEDGVKRTVDEQMAAVVPQDKWITAFAQKGDIIFADTHGYHKGGLARESDRLLYTCMYTSPACQRWYFGKN